ncbi:MAG: sugar nucleotide-binding protein [Actinobacteria bacterium]|nr:sugar nucleotide-binding protein [Actinomycetota bacterium]
MAAGRSASQGVCSGLPAVKALVLGSSGFLGSYLGFALPGLGWQVAGISRDGAEFFPGHRHVNSADEIDGVLQGGGYDLVINAIAMASHERCDTDPAQALLINATLPGRWSAACARTGMKFVHISTDAVFDGESTTPYEEADSPKPLGVYGTSKRAGEEAVSQANPDALILRTNFYGWSRAGNTGILDFFVNAFSQGTAITGFTDYRVSSIYTGDLVDAMVGAVSGDARGVFHAAASDAASKYDFGLAVAAEFGLDSSSMIPGTLADVATLVARGRNLALSTAKIEGVLGRPMPSSFSGLARARAERLALMDYFGHSTL